MEDSPLIQNHWLLQPRSKFLFATSAVITTTIIAFVVAANLVLSSRGKLPIPAEGVLVEVVGAFVGIVGALAALYLWVGMGLYWLRLDHSSSAAKRLWFVVLVALNWVGAIVYYLAVYRRAVSGGGSR